MITIFAKFFKNLNFSTKQFIIPIILCTIALTVGVVNIFSSDDQKTSITSEWLKQSLINVSELSVLEYNYTNVAKFEDTNKVLGLTMPFSQKYFIVAYDGKVKAGIDLNDIEVSVNDNNIKISMSEPKIISHEMFDDKLEIFDEQNAIFNPIQVEDFTGFIQEQKDKLELEIIEGGLLVEAEIKSKEFIQQFLVNMLPENYELEII